jgi:hypothetical protein
MPQQNDPRFRPRYVEESEGLAREEDLRPRSTDYGLMSEKLEEVTLAPTVELVPLAHQLLQDEDADSLSTAPDFGIASLLTEHRTERLSALLARADGMIAAGQWRPALLVLQDARRVDPDAVQPAAMQVRCLMECGAHEAALRVLAYLRDRITEPDVRVALLRQETACIREVTRAVETRVLGLVQEQKLDEAIGLIADGLARQPSNVVFLHHFAKLHYLRGDIPAARAAVAEARRHIGRENLDLIAELERLLDFGIHERAVETARRALRSGAAAQALRELDALAADLAGNEHYDGLRAYARVRAAGAGASASPGATADAALVQQTLRWVLAEELREGGDALGRGAFTRADKLFERAAAIDPRCGAVCYRHAQALHGAYLAAAPRSGSVQQLARAAELAGRARIDGAYEDQAAALLAAIRASGGDGRLSMGG